MNMYIERKGSVCAWVNVTFLVHGAVAFFMPCFEIASPPVHMHFSLFSIRS